MGKRMKKVITITDAFRDMADTYDAMERFLPGAHPRAEATRLLRAYFEAAPGDRQAIEVKINELKGRAHEQA